MATQEDREILRQFHQNMFPTEGFDTGKFAYHWETTGEDQRYIYSAKSLGWEIVKGEMPENPDMRDEKGNCAFGDVVLMRMPKERRQQIDRAMTALNRETLGELSDEEIQRDIDEKLSRLLGHDVKLSFQFKDQRDPRKDRS